VDDAKDVAVSNAFGHKFDNELVRDIVKERLYVRIEHMFVALLAKL